MGSQPGKTRAHLAAELRRLRRTTGLNGTDFGDLIGASQSKVSKTERGETLPPADTVEAWARAANADEATVERLTSLADELLTEIADWSEEEGTFAERNKGIGDVERASRQILNFQPSAVSGLLQTADYARRVITMLDPDSARDVGAGVAKRMERQTILYDLEKRFEFILTEGALRWRPGPPQLMRAQLDRLISIATLPNVTIGVLPFDAEAATLQLNGFTIFDNPEDPFVLVETYTQELRVRKEKHVASYRQTFERFRASAAFGDEATALIRSVMNDLPLD
ncbi:helix-turn-helix domain-containing protein [Actinomadura luteofluorescens]|uniref:helix-turn-helix domain-containing protein n=1 Tax=Actinomadura luteofluorescens TaxID=46163 RepID=UPI003D94E224